MKILITGAHFTPAVAVAEELKKYSGVKIVYVGRDKTLEGDQSKSVESQVLPSLGMKFIPIIAGRLQRSFTIYTIPSLLKIPVGFIQSLLIILTERPDVILSFGGYVAVPIVFTGWLFSIPIIVHEQTLVIGLANKISSYFADKIALSFKQVNGFDKTKTIVTGNPIRSMILSAKEGQENKEKRGRVDLPVILITGGNQGSHTINKTVEECLGKLTRLAFIIHVTGNNKFKDFERLELLGDFGGKYMVSKWLGEDYATILQKANLVVSRAGINTLSELAFMGKPALVIPFEPLYKDEQVKNAKYFEKQNLVRILPQAKLSANSLLENIKFMLGNLDQLTKKAQVAKKAIIPDAAKRIALETILLTKSINR